MTLIAHLYHGSSTRRIIGFGVYQGDFHGVAPYCLYNQHRIHQELKEQSSAFVSGDVEHQHAQLSQYSWQFHCNGLFKTPIAA